MPDRCVWPKARAKDAFVYLRPCRPGSLRPISDLHWRIRTFRGLAGRHFYHNIDSDRHDRPTKGAPPHPAGLFTGGRYDVGTIWGAQAIDARTKS